MKKLNHYFIVVLLLATVYCTYSQVIPSSRSVEWSLAGHQGAMPLYPIVKNITDFGGTGDGRVANDMALQNAIAGLAGQNGIIIFPAGTFLFKAPVSLRTGIVLKGAGAANTVLQFDLAGAGNLITVAGNSTSAIAYITASLFKSQSSLTVDDASLFNTGDYIKIYQNDSSLINDIWALESVGQILRIVGISGQRISFSNPLRRNYLLSDQPKIRKLEIVSGSGIECLKIKRLDSTAGITANILFSNAANCWVKGVESDSCNFAHIQVDNSSNIEITNCYFHGAFAYGSGGQGYGIECGSCSGECLVENNIFNHLRHSMLLQSGANGNVFDYNYSINPYKSESTPNDLSADIALHGNYPYANLFEGNIVQNIFIDNSHYINGPYNTFFRNRAESYGIVIIAGAGDSTNLAGNEITGTGFAKGNYSITGAGNFEYGNNKNNIVVPAGGTAIADKSYIYNGTPAFWNISSAWPPIGIPYLINTGTIPAKERFLKGSGFTFCVAALPVNYSFNGNGNWSDISNWSNSVLPPVLLSVGSEIIIDPPATGQCVLDVPYIVNPGGKLTVKEGKHFVIKGSLTLMQ